MGSGSFDCAITSVALGSVKRLVRHPDQGSFVLGRCRGETAESQANCATDNLTTILHRHRLDCIAYALADLSRTFNGRTRQYAQELFTTIANQNVTFAQELFGLFCNIREDPITDKMPV